MNNPSFPEEERNDQPDSPASNILHFAEHSRDEAESFIRTNPLPIVLGALAIGIVLGLMGSRLEPTFRERYVDDPLREIRDLLQHQGDRIYGSAKGGYEDGASAVGKAFKSIRRQLHLF